MLASGTLYSTDPLLFRSERDSESYFAFSMLVYILDHEIIIQMRIYKSPASFTFQIRGGSVIFAAQVTPPSSIVACTT